MNIVESIQETTDDVGRSIAAETRTLRDGIRLTNRRAVEYVKGNPAKCLLGALAVGFIVGRLAAR